MTVLNDLVVDDMASGLIVYWAIVEGEIHVSQWPALILHVKVWREPALWEHDDDEDILATFYVDTSFRVPEKLIEVLEGVADEHLWSVVITAPSLKWRYHPYNGGADVITESQAARDSLSSRPRAWLSARPDGL